MNHFISQIAVTVFSVLQLAAAQAHTHDKTETFRAQGPCKGSGHGAGGRLLVLQRGIHDAACRVVL